MSDQQKMHRPIRSFVLRQGRLTPGQQRAFDALWPLYGIEYTGEPLDLTTLFGNDNPTLVEIGFGNGESLAQMAAAHPEQNYLGIEVHGPGVGHLLLKIQELGLTNIRIMKHDAIEVLNNCLADASLQGLFLFFPDPWHKKRHHKRRILNPTFLKQLYRVIKPGGFFHAATDWEEYAVQMMEVLGEASEQFQNSVGKGNYTPRPEYRPLTKFEQRGHRLGHGVWDLIFIRRPA
ncbi:MAG: tRNA (guanosine(46)-N7)-methyltransferase TrmB [Sedimenticola sp.]|uniref:tRNA (guanine-N(7)-)-methyltransferase n=1 Tax=Sedimenticola thiotaurini TaxID=1543721 RepID=A0A558DG18_9GAMM|nr:tRNA (guanosine(46)-N7)-methyltransferase TrmB [Sedimenticola sp.]TVT59975.1 MAG: tRNA (guanosine(46)-N7)-methyltransferase TrmB [Sedimenticola thiotaurini]MCW8881405.1 tRNA (guanosine(46)-N7)-methyltransferase TrmB [Sedimenticola sp.]MCW8947914.1 tRNA (guanosine(46)-N7)-methyltransferase TrmB [Sedimenticola sp.]MCW8975732.1 tRNA (guanosine(46)-N7)-methyltransferase TrmB [Sedimenticola sp.]